MQNAIRALTCVMALSAAMAGVSVAPAIAQTTTLAPSADTMSSTPAPHAVRRHRMRRTPSQSAPARDVGPTSSVTGTSSRNLGDANSGLPRVPGAPAAGGDGSTGGK